MYSYWNTIERTVTPPTELRKICYTCGCCGGPIYEGDEYFDFRGFGIGLGVMCQDCIDDAHHYDAEREV